MPYNDRCFLGGRRRPLFLGRFVLTKTHAGLENSSALFGKRRQFVPCRVVARSDSLPYLIHREITISLNSQGGVKLPTGGKGGNAKPASAFGPLDLGVSRSGVIPEPTVIVRMKEKELVSA